MKTKRHLVAFIDILGFKKLIDGYFSGKDLKSLKQLQQAIKDAENYAIKFSKKGLKDFDIRLSFKQFSDCVCISMPFDSKENNLTLTRFMSFVNIVKLYQYILLDSGILIRGGISIGGHIQNSNIIFSEALVKAYNLESKKAIYPRILIDKELINFIDNILKIESENVDEIFTFMSKTIIKDWDDEIFISPFELENDLKNIFDTVGEDNFMEAIKGIKHSNIPANISKEEFVKLILDGAKEQNEHESIANNLETILNFLNDYVVNNPEEKSDILLKYKWLQQFINWTMDPVNSQIKFERYYK